jgi:hypothetical protein
VDDSQEMDILSNSVFTLPQTALTAAQHAALLIFASLCTLAGRLAVVI